MRTLSLLSSAFGLLALLAAPSAYAQTCLTPDLDGDGHDRIVCGGDDCDDSTATRYPGNVEVCDAADVDEDCDYSTPGQRDVDGDGFNDALCRNLNGSAVISGGDDCDDFSASVHRIATEVCNGIDDNCDGAIDDGLRREYWLDADGDGFGSQSVGLLCAQASAGYATRGGDCDDASESIFPGMQICTSDVDVDICGNDGLWVADSCDTDQTCLGQPNELGVCSSVSTGPGNSGNSNRGGNGNGNGKFQGN